MKEEKDFELMDWKELERSCRDQVLSSKKAIAINNYILFWAQENIKRMGGKTIEEEEEDAKNRMGQLAEGSTGV